LEKGGKGEERVVTEGRATEGDRGRRDGEEERGRQVEGGSRLDEKVRRYEEEEDTDG
jgi:hypothetical protein